MLLINKSKISSIHEGNFALSRIITDLLNLFETTAMI